MKMLQKNSPHPSPLPNWGEGNVAPELAWGVIAACCVAFFLSAFGIQSAILALLGILVLWWTFEYPEKSFLTLIILSPLLPLIKATQTLGNVTLIKDIIIITLFFRIFLIPLLTQKLPYRRNAFFSPIAALTIWACFEVVRAGITTLSILRLRDIVLYILLYFGVLYLPHTAKRMRIRMIVFFITLGIVMLLGIFQFLHLPDSTVLRFDPVRQIWIPRIASTFAHPTVFAEFLITGIVLLLGLLLKKKKPHVPIAELLLLVSATLLLYFTYTRAGWIGFVVAGMAVGATYLTRATSLVIRKSVIVTLLVLLSVVGFALFRFTPVGTFLNSAFDANYASNADRIVFIVQLISQTTNTDAIIGKGLGNTISKTRDGGDATAFDIASGESRTVQLSKDQTLVDNQYLKTFIEMGVVGVVLTFWLFFRFFLTAKKALPSALGIACIGFLAAFMIQALFVDIWDVYPTNAIFWTLAALISHTSIKQGDKLSVSSLR